MSEAERATEFDDEIERLGAEVARLKEMNDVLLSTESSYERGLEAVDAVAHEHFKAIGQPFDSATTFGEAAACLEDELPRLRAEVARLAAERDAYLARLLDACNLDPEILPGDPGDAALSVVRRKVAEYDRNIEAARQAVDRWREAAEAEHGARLEAEAERDRLIDGCIVSSWRNPEFYPHAGGYGFEWRFGPMGDFVRTREQAVAAVREAAGLDRGEGKERG